MGPSKTNPYLKIQTGYIILPSILLGIAWFLFVNYKGIILPIDTIKVWGPLADFLIENNFSIFALSSSSDEFQAIPIPYFLWISTVALNKLLLGDNWAAGVVLLNLLAGVFVAVLLLKATWTSTRKPACMIFTGLALALCYDFIQWIPFVLSETLYTSISFSIIYLVISLYQQPSEPQKRATGVLVLVVIALFFRPSAPPVLFFTIASLSMVFFFNLSTADIAKRHKFILCFSLYSCLIAITIGLVHSYLMFHVDQWPFPIFRDLADYTSAGFRIGEVQNGRIGTYHFPPENILDYSLIIVHRIFVFFAVDTKLFSPAHSLANYIFFIPVYGLSVFALAQIFKNENGPSTINWCLIFLCGSYILIVAFFHSLLLVDYDWRYRTPCMPVLILLATLGLNELINKFPQKNLAN
jgi:hypothetical protein